MYPLMGTKCGVQYFQRLAGFRDVMNAKNTNALAGGEGGGGERPRKPRFGVIHIGDAADEALARRADHHGAAETVKYCSLGQISQALYEVGGQYRRNM